MSAARASVAALAVVASLASGGAGAQASPPTGGLAFHYELVPSEMVLVHPRANVERRMHPGDSRKGRSHLVLSLFDSQSGARISQAEVLVQVTPPAGATMTEPLERVDIADQPSFSAYVPIGAPGVYKIRFDVKRPGVEATVSAEFEHRVAERRR
jgi:hypothetical protein